MSDGSYSIATQQNSHSISHLLGTVTNIVIGQQGLNHRPVHPSL